MISSSSSSTLLFPSMSSIIIYLLSFFIPSYTIILNDPTLCIFFRESMAFEDCWQGHINSVAVLSCHVHWLHHYVSLLQLNWSQASPRPFFELWLLLLYMMPPFLDVMIHMAFHSIGQGVPNNHSSNQTEHLIWSSIAMYLIILSKKPWINGSCVKAYFHPCIKLPISFEKTSKSTSFIIALFSIICRCK